MATPTYHINSTNGRFSIARLIGFGIRALDRVAPARVDTLLGDMFLTPRKIRRPEREREWLATARRVDHLTSSGHRLALWIWGEADRGTVLLVHGWEGRGSQMGAIATALADEGFRVVAPDLPAHGESLGRQTNVVECAGVIDDLWRRFGHFSAIVAHSFGCAATTAAIGRGVTADRLVFISPANDYIHFGSFFASTLGLPRGTASRIRDEVVDRLGVSWDVLQPDHVAKSADVPLLVIHDEHDRETPVEQGEKVARVWPGGELFATRGLGHRRIVRDESVVERIVSRLTARRNLAMAV
jgi:pimeloyl-ACP methyl ester carboxylesterase